ncbi:MAG: 3-phosphoshikimate 1-carboxyvinyltransferase [Planctomycetota bacterium]
MLNYPRTLRFAGRPAAGNVTLPPGKSDLIRAAFLAALGRSIVDLPRSPAEDVARALEWIELCGARIIENNNSPSMGNIGICGIGEAPRFGSREFDAGDAASVLRMGMFHCAAGFGNATISGSPALARRPIAEGIELLTKLGAGVSGLSLPIAITARGIRGGSLQIESGATSQFVSGILLASPVFEEELKLTIPEDFPSRFYLNQTLRLMRDFGCEPREVTTAGKTVIITKPCVPDGSAFRPRVDASHRLLFACVPAILGGTVSLAHPVREDLSGDPGIVILQNAGMRCEWRGGGGAILDISGKLTKGFDADCAADPDLVPPLAIAALFAPAPSNLKNVGRLRWKESDRLAALELAIQQLGGGFETRPSPENPSEWNLQITPAELMPSKKTRAASLATFHDHRLAMSFALAGLAIEGVAIDDAGCVAKSMADFFERLDRSIS